MKTILAPIDFSPCSKLVIAEAIMLARATGARLLLLHVIPPLPGSVTEFSFAEATARITDAVAQSAGERLAHLQRQLFARNVTAATFHVTGVPGAAIVSRASEFNASYIVIGSHGHGALYELMVGSTASRVIREATCPVVVVPAQAKPLPGALSLDLELAEAVENTPPELHPAQQ